MKIKTLLTPRHHWLHNRTKDCIDSMKELEKINNWEEYRIHARNLAEELLYAVTEWEKYYTPK